MDQSPLIAAAILTIRPDALDGFREYETQAAAILSRYGGAIERTIVVEPTLSGEPMREVHIVTFPARAAFDAYRTDPDLAALGELRLSCIAYTEILLGRAGPDYQALAAACDSARPPVEPD